MNNFLIAMTLGLMLSSVSFAEENKDSTGNAHETTHTTDETKPGETATSDHKEMKDHAAPHEKKKKKSGHRKGHHHKKSKHTHKTEKHHGEQHEHKAVEGDAKKAEHAEEPMHHEASPEKKD